jgi:OOP family OmpA-OmpF porin
MKIRHMTISMLLLSGLFGCATGGGLTRKDVLQQYENVGKLNTELTAAEGNGAELLAPEGFEEAKAKLEEAIQLAIDAKKDKADSVADEGLKTLDEVNKHMKETREVMAEVLETRDRSKAAGAPGLFSQEYEQLEKRLRKATNLIEQGRTDKAREARPELLDAYSDLELRALKKGSVEAAKAAIENAEQKEADDYAPKTLKLAEEEIKLVTSVLEADRTQVDKANAHAERVIWLSGRAVAITDIVKMFKSRNYTGEDIVLWYQDQLDTVNEHLADELPFNEPNKVVVEGLRDTIGSVIKALADARDMIQKNQSRIEELEKKAAKERTEYDAIIKEILGASRKDLVALRKKYSSKLSDDAKGRAEAERIELEIKEKAEYVKSIFRENEATVSQDGNNVLIQIHGFQFKTGGSEIGAANFGLLNKAISAIQQFPNSHIVVSGHTDSKGNADRNLALSIKRALNVAKFMTEVGGIPSKRVESQGFGETKPVASNENRKGRALNRRIEFLIVNE